MKAGRKKLPTKNKKKTVYLHIEGYKIDNLGGKKAVQEIGHTAVNDAYSKKVKEK